MEEEPNQQNDSGKCYVESINGGYTVSKDEQEVIQYLIENNLDQYMNELYFVHFHILL